MSQPLHGVTADDFLSYITIKRRGKVYFCIDCGKELTPDDPSPCCVICDEAYGEYITEVRERMDEMLLDDDMEI